MGVATKEALIKMSSTEPAKILIVDDDPRNLLALDNVLQGLGADIVQAHSGTEALRQLLQGQFAVILLDVHMPGMDGFETAALIRQRARNKHIPIIFLSAMNKADADVDAGYAIGAEEYVLKPFVPEILRAKVAALIGRPRRPIGAGLESS